MKHLVRFIGTQIVLLGGAGSTTGPKKRTRLDVEEVTNPSSSGSHCGAFAVFYESTTTKSS